MQSRQKARGDRLGIGGRRTSRGQLDGEDHASAHGLKDVWPRDGVDDLEAPKGASAPVFRFS